MIGAPAASAAGRLRCRPGSASRACAMKKSWSPNQSFGGSSEREVEHHRAVAVEHQDRAHVFRRGGAVEQHELADLRRQPVEAGTAEILHHRQERQVVEVDVALDVAFDRRDEIGGGDARLVPGAAADVEREQRADDAKTDGDQVETEIPPARQRRALTVGVSVDSGREGHRGSLVAGAQRLTRRSLSVLKRFRQVAVR